MEREQIIGLIKTYFNLEDSDVKTFDKLSNIFGATNESTFEDLIGLIGAALHLEKHQVIEPSTEVKVKPSKLDLTDKKILKNLVLERPICGLDVETTGLDKAKERIVEISITKVYPNGEIKSRTKLINPLIPIPKEASDIHGITDDKVANETPFANNAKWIYQTLKDCDFIMYNGLAFDLAFIGEEFLRCGYEIDWKYYLIDPYKNFVKEEPRTLDAAYKFYCDKESDNLHSAEEDVMVMLEVLDAQIDKYGYEHTVEAVAVKRDCIDLDNKIKKTEEGDYVWNFGKNKDKGIFNDLGYCQWFLSGGFCLESKNHLKRLLIENKYGVFSNPNNPFDLIISNR